MHKYTSHEKTCHREYSRSKSNSLLSLKAKYIYFAKLRVILSSAFINLLNTVMSLRSVDKCGKYRSRRAVHNKMKLILDDTTITHIA